MKESTILEKAKMIANSYVALEPEAYSSITFSSSLSDLTHALAQELQRIILHVLICHFLF